MGKVEMPGIQPGWLYHFDMEYNVFRNTMPDKLCGQ
jgi:hypothetical protein